MVFVVDDGVFDAPIDRVWKYLQSPQDHQHSSIPRTEVLEQKGNTVKIRQTLATPKGKEEAVQQMVLDPPFGFRLETLEGSQKGSRNVHTYVPMGSKTKVIVAGDFHVKGLDETATRKAILDYFAMVFDEDNRNLQHMK
ncbi:MAG: SRPBCC family protein [Methanobacteriota archaeon]